MLVIFLGAPGTGKGTVAKYLVDKKGFIQVSTGDIMRVAIASKSELGKKLDTIIASGQLVPDELTNQIFVDHLKTLDLSKQKIILDGYPRTIFQAEFFENYLKENNQTLNKVIQFELSEKEVVERISGRMVCKNCGAIYHKIHLPPKVENTCDNCQGLLFTRPDDSADKVVVRLKEYETKTQSLIDFYTKKNLIVKINANQVIKKIGKSILKGIK